MRPVREKLWTVLTTAKGQVKVFMNGAPLTSKSGEGYGILLEVCYTTQSGKGMIQVRVVFRFSHSLRTLIWHNWPAKWEFGRTQINTLTRAWYALLQKNTRDYQASVPSNCSIFFANRWVKTLVAAFSGLTAAFYFESTPVRTHRIAPTFVNA